VGNVWSREVAVVEDGGDMEEDEEGEVAESP